MPRLLFDLGNSRLKWALEDEGCLLEQGALAYRNIAHLNRALPHHALFLPAFGVNVASVATVEKVRAHLESIGIADVRFLKSQAVFKDLKNGYEYPERLGPDRWAALVGAWCLRKAPTLVVCAGTATTVDFLDTDGQGGVFRGGVILPGLSLMHRSLARKTAHLPPLQAPPWPDARWPIHTEEAISNGCLHAQAGAIERLFAQIPTDKNPLCWLAGGAAPALAACLRIPFALRPYLVLEGVGHLAREAQEAGKRTTEIQ
jgi:type III pantothenate kinase